MPPKQRNKARKTQKRDFRNENPHGEACLGRTIKHVLGEQPGLRPREKRVHTKTRASRGK